MQAAISATALGALPGYSSTLEPSRRLVYLPGESDEWDGLPRGIVEVYQWNGKRNVFLGREPLSLSATLPRCLALSPDGRSLVVAAFGGGIYNVLPVERDGRLGSVSGIFKELGSGPHPVQQTSAHPHSLLFDRTGRYLLSSDFGCDRLSVFSFTREGGLERISRLQLQPGSGPGSMTMASDGINLSVRNELSGGIARYRFDVATANITFVDS